MRKALAALVAPALVCGFTIVLSGCTDESGVKQDTKVTAPDGSTTNVHKEVTTNTKGNNPPPAPVDKN